MNIDDLRCVVRVSTSAWFDGRSLNSQKKFTVLRRKSTTGDLIKYECDNSGADDALTALNPPADIKDGVYELKAIYFRDCETGMIDDIDYKFLPLDENELN